MDNDIDEINRKIAALAVQGTTLVSGLSLIKSVPRRSVIEILKSGGLLSAEEIALRNPSNLRIKVNVDENREHPMHHNVIYCSVAVKGKESESVVNKFFGGTVIVIKDSVLRRPNTTYTDRDTLLDRRADIENKYYKGELFTDSELVRSGKNMSAHYMEMQIRSKISLGEIEKIILDNNPPTTEEIQFANDVGVTLVFKDVVVAGTLPKNYNVVTESGGDVLPILSTPTVPALDIVPAQLPDFKELPKLPYVPKNPVPVLPGTEPTDGHIPNMKEFASIAACAKHLRAGKPVELNFPPFVLPTSCQDAARDGNATVYYEGVAYKYPFNP